MSVFHRFIFLIHFLVTVHSGFSQDAQPQLSLQKGHYSAITRVAISPDSRLLATYGLDQQLVLWHLKSGGQMFSTYLHNDSIEQIEFDKLSHQLMLYSSRYTYHLNLDSFVIKTTGATEDYTTHKSCIRDSILYKINEANIISWNIKTFKKTSANSADYHDRWFTSFVYNTSNHKIYAACQDGKIYIFDRNLKYQKKLGIHLGSVNDLALSPDMQYLYSVSDDRSVIKWNIATENVEQRLVGIGYPVYGISSSPSGNNIQFGDEIGYLKTLDLRNLHLPLSASKKINDPLTFTAASKDSTFIYGGKSNKVFIDFPDGKRTRVKSVYASTNLFLYNLFANVLGYYLPPGSSTDAMQLNSSGSLLVYSNASRWGNGNHTRIIDLKSGKRSRRLYQFMDDSGTPVHFLNDTCFFSIHSGEGMRLWAVNNNDVSDIHHALLPITGHISNAVRLDSNRLVIILQQKLYIINCSDTNRSKLSELELNKLFTFNSAESRNCAIPKLISHHTPREVFPYKTGYFAWSDADNNLHICKYNDTLIELGVLQGHTDSVTSLHYNSRLGLLFTSSYDATIKVWNEKDLKLVITIVPIGIKNALFITPDNYYMIGGKELGSFGFRIGDQYYAADQFDAFYNRPDKVIKALGLADSAETSLLETAYHKRIQRLGFSEEMLKADYHLPEITIRNAKSLPTTTEKDTITLYLTLKDSKYKLDRLNVWINNVPVYGKLGYSLKQFNTGIYEINVPLLLAHGNNLIQVSTHNQAGAESYKEPVKITCNGQAFKPDLYLITLGVSKYRDESYDLKYAAKDAADIEAIFKKGKQYGKVYSKTLLNEQVTRDAVINLKAHLKTANRNDEVVVFYAGHGLLDTQMNYYLTTHDMDFSNPSAKGISYDEIESLIDSILPLKKILMIDACHSGEIDRDAIVKASTTNQSGHVTAKRPGARGADLNIDDAEKKNNTSMLAQQLFSDIRRGSGATVIAASGGFEFAMESARWNNGLFTYTLLHGLQSKKADLNHDGKIMLSELKQYVGEQVSILSNGLQRPTTRIENPAIDFKIK